MENVGASSNEKNKAATTLFGSCEGKTVSVLFVAFCGKDGERATFSAALRTVHCLDARGCSCLFAHVFGVSAALKKMQAATSAAVLTAEGGRACAPLSPPLHSGVAGPPPIVLAFLASHHGELISGPHLR